MALVWSYVDVRDWEYQHKLKYNLPHNDRVVLVAERDQHIYAARYLPDAGFWVLHGRESLSLNVRYWSDFPTSGWHLVDRRLPDSARTVLVTTRADSRLTAWFDRETRIWLQYGNDITLQVFSWQELPPYPERPE